LLLLCLLPLSALAVREDVEQPVNLEADSVVFNKQAGTAVYTGRVEISQGTLRITADRIEISAPGNEIQSIRAAGRPVNFRQTMDNGRQAVGKAELIQYLVPQKLLVLTGGATLSQDRDTFASNRIEYSTATGELKAGGSTSTAGTQKPGRVRATFYPTNKAQ